MHVEGEVELEVVVVEDMAFHVAEVGDQLFNFGRCHRNAKDIVLVLRHPTLLDHQVLRCKWICIVHLVQLFGVLKVYLKDVPLSAVSWVFPNASCKSIAVLHPLEAAFGRHLAHSPAMKVVGIQVEDVAVRPLGVIALHPGVIGLGIAFRGHGDTHSHPLLNEEVLVIVCEQLQPYTCFLEQCIPREIWPGVVMCGV